MTSATDTAPQTPAEHLIRQLYGLGAVRRELAKAATRSSTPCFAALGTLRRYGPSRLSVVATHLQVDLSVASRQVAHLVDAGLVERLKDPDDGRAHLLHVTESGHAAVQAAHDEMTSLLAGALADWDPSEVTTLANGLERLAESFNTAPAHTNQEIAR